MVSGFAEEERIVIEARQRRRMEEERQQMANIQVKAHLQSFPGSELFQFVVVQNPASAPSPTPASAPATSHAAAPMTATPAMNLEAPVSSQKDVGSQLGKL